MSSSPPNGASGGTPGTGGTAPPGIPGLSDGPSTPPGPGAAAPATGGTGGTPATDLHSSLGSSSLGSGNPLSSLFGESNPVIQLVQSLMKSGQGGGAGGTTSSANFGQPGPKSQSWWLG